ncbi:MAG TPA: carbohydrate ABC transporter permease [Caldilineaceae bacterium]|nr:carbohydrate ABC transporter permease [Caldilineaceae bacterium]
MTAISNKPTARRLQHMLYRLPVPWKAIFLHLAALLTFFYLVGPFVWIVISSFMTREEAMSAPPHWIPHEPTLMNYAAYFNPEVVNNMREERRLTVGAVVRDVPIALRNSITVSFSVAVLNILLGSLSAYPFARLAFRGKTALLVFYLLTRMVPALALILPVYLVLRRIGGLNQLWGLILMYLTFTLPYSVWILKNYFQTIPRDLEDAARVDRCNWLQAMVKVILPVSLPGIIAVGIYSFMAAWGEFFFAMILTQTASARTMPVLVAFLSNELATEYGFLTSAAVLAVILPLALALIFQRMIISGIGAGAIKG